jgi:hypothetical protein
VHLRCFFTIGFNVAGGLRRVAVAGLRRTEVSDRTTRPPSTLDAAAAAAAPTAAARPAARQISRLGKQKRQYPRLVGRTLRRFTKRTGRFRGLTGKRRQSSNADLRPPSVLSTRQSRSLWRRSLMRSQWTAYAPRHAADTMSGKADAGSIGLPPHIATAPQRAIHRCVTSPTAP